jgi:hypothetical protein
MPPRSGEKAGPKRSKKRAGSKIKTSRKGMGTIRCAPWKIPGDAKKLVKDIGDFKI